MSVAPPPPPSRPSPARQRLSPDVRVRQILDAALAEFSARGYAATRVDDIARRAGLSKGGFYAHFESKERVFEALLTHMLAPPELDADTVLGGCADCRALAGRIVDLLFERLSRPEALATLRLLVAEGERVPHLVALWYGNTVESLSVHLGEVLERAVGRGLCRPGVAVERPWMVLAPVVHVTMARLVFAGLPVPSLRNSRNDCVDALCELLAPR